MILTRDSNMETIDLAHEILEDMVLLGNDLVKTVAGKKRACQRARVASVKLGKKFKEFRRISAVELDLRRSNANKNN